MSELLSAKISRRRFCCPAILTVATSSSAPIASNPGLYYLVRSPLDVLLAHENGVENVVAFLTDIGPQQLEMLAAVMDDLKCECVELF
jgi:hypothetical protein